MGLEKLTEKEKRILDNARRYSTKKWITIFWISLVITFLMMCYAYVKPYFSKDTLFGCFVSFFVFLSFLGILIRDRIWLRILDKLTK